MHSPKLHDLYIHSFECVIAHSNLPLVTEQEKRITLKQTQSIAFKDKTGVIAVMIA